MIGRLVGRSVARLLSLVRFAAASRNYTGKKSQGGTVDGRVASVWHGDGTRLRLGKRAGGHASVVRTGRTTVGRTDGSPSERAGERGLSGRLVGRSVDWAVWDGPQSWLRKGTEMVARRWHDKRYESGDDGRSRWRWTTNRGVLVVVVQCRGSVSTDSVPTSCG